MIKKETINRFEESNFKNIIKPFFEKLGFKFKKREGTKKMGDFVMTFSCYCSDSYRKVYFNPSTQTPEIQFVSYLRVWHPAYNQWCSDHNFWGSEAKNSVASLFFTLPINNSELLSSDFFTPVFGDPKNGLHTQDYGFPSFIDLMNPEHKPQNWYLLIEQTAALADLETMYCSDPGKPGKYMNLIYRNEMERAKTAAFELLDFYIKAYHNESKLDYKQSWLSALQHLQNNAKQFLNIDLVLPSLLEWKSEPGNSKGNIPIINLNWNALYTLKDLPKSIYRKFLNNDGTLMTTHPSGYQGEIIIWDTDGQIKHQIDYNAINFSDFLGFIPEKKAYFMANLLIFEDGRTIYLPIDKEKDGNGAWVYESVWADMAFDTSLTNYIVCSGKEKYINTVWFFNENFEIVKKFEVEGTPKKIYPEKQWIVVLNDRKNDCIIYDYEGNMVHFFETKNAMFHHQFFDNYRWLIVYGYHSYSEVYELSTQKTFKIYGHPTFVSGYKEHFQQVNHNFGLSNIAFSPDAQYAVGSAEHGKWVVWTMPDWKRQEILPNAAYLADSLEPYTFEIDGESYFVNNGQVISQEIVVRSSFMHRASAIYFFDNGAYFAMVIKDKILIFNNKFQHLSTHNGFDNMVLKGKYFCSYTDKNLNVFKIE